jgi:hypothetical protein
MQNIVQNLLRSPSEQPTALVAFLTDRYGRLALTRAAGEADAAARRGDPDQNLLWTKVVATLRHMALATDVQEPVQA